MEFRAIKKRSWFNRILMKWKIDLCFETHEANADVEKLCFALSIQLSTSWKLNNYDFFHELLQLTRRTSFAEIIYAWNVLEKHFDSLEKVVYIQLENKKLFRVNVIIERCECSTMERWIKKHPSERATFVGRWSLISFDRAPPRNEMSEVVEKSVPARAGATFRFITNLLFLIASTGSDFLACNAVDIKTYPSALCSTPLAQREMFMQIDEN